MKRQGKTELKTKENEPQQACSLCGQLYKNFTFKGGYICESCLHSIKDRESSSASDEE